MASLLDQLQQRLGAGAQPVAAPSVNIEEILQAKRGKAAPVQGGGIANTSLGADIATNQANAALAQQQQAGALQANQLGAIAEAGAQKADLQQAQLASSERQGVASLQSNAARARAETAGAEQMQMQQLAAGRAKGLADLNNRAALTAQKMAADRGVTMDALFADAQQEKAQLGSRRDTAQLEQKAAIMAWSDKAYMNELQRIGDQRKLTDSIAFDKEAQRVALGREFANKLDVMNFNISQDAKERDILDQVAQLSNYEIIDLADAAIRQANMKSQYEAAGTITREAAPYAISALSPTPKVEG